MNDNRVKVGVSKSLLTEIHKMFPSNTATSSLQRALVFLIENSDEVAQLVAQRGYNDETEHKQ
ncbi:hypothetical protein [Endozoicomonas sp. ALB032]|uniref:hypothetical protein n=1 Tax=Endozoicomonas sp. ALB032 TaxID=3403082 RepID=UPI003BB69F37